MKRKYEAPVVSFEDFELSTSIAAGCDFKTNHQKDMCAYEPTGRFIFVDGVNDCKTIPEDGTYNGMCYHVPNEYTQLFTS